MRKDWIMSILRATPPWCHLPDCGQNHTARHHWRIHIRVLQSTFRMSPCDSKLGPASTRQSSSRQSPSNLHYYSCCWNHDGRSASGDARPIHLEAANANQAEDWTDLHVRFWFHVRTCQMRLCT